MDSSIVENNQKYNEVKLEYSDSLLDYAKDDLYRALKNYSSIDKDSIEKEWIIKVENKNLKEIVIRDIKEELKTRFSLNTDDYTLSPISLEIEDIETFIIISSSNFEIKKLVITIPDSIEIYADFSGTRISNIENLSKTLNKSIHSESIVVVSDYIKAIEVGKITFTQNQRCKKRNVESSS
ncbi:MAG: hypothetical protein Q9M91_01515 [Candidatus Dojkabacteria bacterium]|nr:hypothetical protein [Candidatus Dojkabacteria bacterium]